MKTTRTGTKPLMKAVCLMALALSACVVGFALNDSEDIAAATYGSESSPLTSLNESAYDVDGSTYYVAVGASVSITSGRFSVYSVTAGYGLSEKDGNLSGTISKAGKITVTLLNSVDEPIGEVVIIAVQVTKVTSVTVSASATTLYVGGTITLTATTTPTNAADRTVTWTIASGATNATIQSSADTATGGTCVLSGVKAGIVAVKVTADGGTNVSKTMTVTVKSSDYTLKFDANGGSGAPDSLKSTSTTGSCAFTIPSTAPTKTNCNFLGWAESSTATSAKYKAGGTYTATSSTTTLYAVWQELSKDYTLDFDANGGSGAPGSLTGSSGTGSYTFTIPATIPSKDGYTFLGWSKSSSATSAAYKAGGTYTATSTPITLYAVWETTKYTSTLNYSATGATNVPSADSYIGTETTDHTFTISSSKPAKDGCTFAGWSTTNGATKASYQPGDTIPVPYNGSVTLYAVWNTNTYTSTLNYSADGASNVPTAQTFNGTSVVDHTFTISSVKPAKDGFTFKGWATSGGSSAAEYQPGDTISVAYNGTVTLYAVWMQNLSITSNAAVTCVVDTLYVYNVQTNVDGCTVSVTGASWLKVSGSTVSGTPTSAGSYTVTVTVAKEGCVSASQTFELEVLTGFNAPPSAAGIFAYVS